MSNRRTWADDIGPDGITIDAEGAIWTSANEGPYVVRVHEGGRISERIEHDQMCFACMLGGPDGKTLFMVTAEWRGPEAVHDIAAERTGRVLIADAPAPKAGWP